MKKSFIVCSVVFALITLNTLLATAVPIGPSNDAMNYMLKTPDLSRVAAGIYYNQLKREMKLNRSVFSNEMTADRVTGYIGFDFLKWLNVYAIGGYTTAKMDNIPAGDGGMTFGAGVSVNVLNHFIREPVPMEDAFRINFGAQILSNEAEIGYDKIRWVETSAALTFAIVNHIDGNKDFSPESISLYAGPSVSIIDNNAFSSKTKGGAVGGIEIFFTDSCALDLRVEYYDSAALSAGINLRF